MKKNVKILLGFNDQDKLNNYKSILESNYNVTVMTSNTGTLVSQLANNQYFDLVLIQYDLNKLTGKALVKNLRSSGTNSLTPIVVWINAEDMVETKNELRFFKNINYETTMPEDVEFPKITNKYLKNSKLASKTKQKFSLNVEFINPFISALIETLKVMGGVSNINAGKLFLLNPDKEKDLNIQLSGVITMVADHFSGKLYISFPVKTYLPIVSAMLAEECAELTEENSDAAAELTNIVYGNAKKVLQQMGYKFKQAIPSLIKGEHRIIQNPALPVITVPFETNLGPFFLAIVFENA